MPTLTAELAPANSTLNCPYRPIQAWLVCISAALFFLYEFVQMSMFNAISTQLLKTFQISAGQYGNLSATYFYVDVFFLIPAGLILDRFSTRKVILLAMFLCVASTFVFAHATSLSLAMLARAVTGIGSAFCLLSCLKLASRWFPPRRMALATGVIVTMAMLGGMIAQTPFALLADAIGWRQAVLINTSIGALMLVIIIIVVKDYPPGYMSSSNNSENFPVSLRFWHSLLVCMRNKQNWLAGLYTSLINLPIFLLGQTWGTLYLIQARNLTHAQANNVTAMIFLGTIIGSPIFGWLSDKIGLRRRPMLIGGSLSLATILILLFTNNLTYPALILIFLMLGFFTSSQVLGYPVVAESNATNNTGTALGIASVIIMLGGTTEPLYGWLLELHWNGTIIADIPYYSHSDFLSAMLIMPIAFLVALICTALLREPFCYPKDN